ncbi:hypothetical protein AWC38_SpisGene19629 [Stylophora pistillata]|uniref:Uncharacterized protein n=1 Tax=Stylophora pistillata TaxID=50429 RepID=A0A2B4RH22_STYPI|nr:hypothetical protein AWC38_SpisGene19629 [Stylophora pistillata]
MPHVIRTVTRSAMIAQYLELGQEESFESFSHATLYRILEVREASQRKALKGIDNVAAEGSAAFETLEVVEELQKGGANPEWIFNIKERLNQGERYMKTDYKVHCKGDSSPCTDHCRVFALSDENNDDYKQECELPHSLQCASSKNLKSVIEEIETCLKNETQSISSYGKEHQEDFAYNFLQAKRHIFDWKAHILRSENQDLAKQDVSRSLDVTSALITRDWALKSQCQRYREKQTEWFGKRGLNWHVSSVVLKQAEERMVVTYTHMFDAFTQDWQCDEGHDIQSTADMREELLERPFQGVTAFVCEVNGKQKSIDLTKIPNSIAYRNFEFEPRGIRVRKAYSVGQDQVFDSSDPRQYARHGHSTVHALIHLMQAIHQATDSGVIIRDHLKWNPHVEYVTAKAAKKLYALRLLKRAGVMPEDMLEIFTGDGWAFALMCRRACEYEPLLQLIPLNIA